MIRILCNYLYLCCKNTTKYAFFLIIPLIVLTASCSQSKDEQESILGKKRVNPNLEERAKAYRDKGGGIFNSSKNQGGTTFEFSTSNPLWRATLETIDFMPLANVDYAGGMIITDWYSSQKEAKEIKLNIRFLSSRLDNTSVKVTGFIKDCTNQNKCTTKATEASFNQEIEEKILNKARQMQIKDASKK
jgi:hypothetical protein